MTIDISQADDRASIISAIANMIQSSLDDRSVKQHAEQILDEYIIRTNHHIWLVNQCAKILKDVVVKFNQDTEQFKTNIEFHDYDKLHESDIIPTYALACHYFYFHKKDVKYKVDEEWLNHEFEEVAWPKHYQRNKHHVAEYYGKKNNEGALVVPETNDVLSLVEMYADWMAVGITTDGTAHEWWTKTYGDDKKWSFTGRDLSVIQNCIYAEDNADNQLAYIKQFKDVEPNWVPPTEINTFDEEEPLTTNEVNDGIENFFNYQSNESLGLKRDDLFIGPIDPMSIDPEKMMKLSEYPDLLLALKKWTTRPDFNLAPQLTMLGKIVDDLYQFKNPITCYRGIRTGFDSRSNKKQNLMGIIDNDITYLRLLKPGFDKPGYVFEYEAAEPMSVARSPYIAKIYGNFIIKTDVPADANKLVITPELSYILQQMEVDYPEYRAVNLSTTHEVIVFPGTKLTFEIVSVYGDISNELETMKEHAFEGLGNTVINGVYYSIESSPDIKQKRLGYSTEAFRPFLNSGDYKTITTKAKPFYNPVGQNSWQHIQQVFTQGSKFVKKLENRELTLLEYAVLLFHDSSVKSDPSKDHHARKSAEIAKKTLVGLFSEAELEEIYTAILEHDKEDNPDWKFSTNTSDLLASADANPPDADWILNKSWTWGIKHGLSNEEKLNNVYNNVRVFYSSLPEEGGMKWPDYYAAYYKKDIDKLRKDLESLTPETCLQRILAYRKKHRLGENDIRLPEPSCETISLEAITANTPDAKRGKISKAHQEQCGKYLYHGTHRDLDIKSLGIHVCKNRANTDIKAPCVYMNRSLGVACLHCVPFMVGHGSNMPNYKEHFVNLEEAIKSDGKVVDVEIVHNDPKLQECSGENDGYIYCVKKEDCIDDLYYATPEEPNNWNFVAYKQLPIDKKIHIKVKWHKKYDEDFAKKVESGYAAVESLIFDEITYSCEAIPAQYVNINFANNAFKKKIYSICKPYYPDAGSHGYEHIHEVLATAYVLKGKKDLTDKEYTAIMFHDVGRVINDDEHNIESEKIARKELPKLNHFTNEELEEIYRAILCHSSSYRKLHNITELDELSELVRSADNGFPQTTYYDMCLRFALWILEGHDNGSDKWKRLNQYKTLTDIAIAIKEAIEYYSNKLYNQNDNSLHSKVFANERKKSIELKNKITIPIIEQTVIEIAKNYGYNLPSNDQISTEALAQDIKKKKQLIIDYICSVCDIMDPSKLNSKRYHRLLDNMNDKEFDQWMNYVKEGKWKIHIVAPNLVVTLKNENSLKAADKVKCKLFHRLWMTDDSTGRQYLTDNEYLVLNLPVRRQQQFLDEKMSVPDNDKQIDGMTGQVTGDSKSSAVTNPEIQILAARGLDATLEEFVNVRGGNIAAYSDFKRQAEETGEIKLNSLDPNTRSRVAVVGQVLLRSMMIDNNIIE